jgi:hypothetical protein
MENFGVSPVTVNYCYLSLSSLSYFNTPNYFDGREILKRREVKEVRKGRQRRKESQWLNLASKVEDEYIDSYGTKILWGISRILLQYALWLLTTKHIDKF